MRRSTPAWITYGVLLSAAILLYAAFLWPLWKPLLLGSVLAGGLRPLHDRLAARLGARPGLAAIFLVIAVIVLLLMPLALVLAVLIPQLVDGIEFVQRTLATSGVAGLIQHVPGSALRHWLGDALAHLPSTASMVSGGQKLVAATLGALSATGTILFDVILMLIALYFLLVDGRALVAWLEEVLPLPGGHFRDLLAQVRAVAVSVIGSTIASGLAQAILAAVAFAIAHVPDPLFFAIIVFFASFVPSIGSAAVMLPAAAILLAVGHPWRALFLAAWGLLVVGTVDNFIKPLFIRGHAKLEGGPVFFSLLGGVLFFGPIGLVVGPLALTFLLGMIRLRDGEPAPAPTPAATE